jgi:hypothetical protein
MREPVMVAGSFVALDTVGVAFFHGVADAVGVVAAACRHAVRRMTKHKNRAKTFFIFAHLLFNLDPFS